MLKCKTETRKHNKNNELSPVKFQERVLAWFEEHGRKTLPWQHKKTPYRVWVSEIMLQQTQVNTVIPYFERFLQTFPTVESLALADQDAVLHLWTGLGYYSRARNLHRTAKIILEFYAGTFPEDLEELQKLPGIGRSTAGAIRSLAFEKPAAILDGNVKRVITRLHGIMEWPGEKKVHDALWVIAEKYSPAHRVADYTQAMMDIGATLCVRSKPHCSHCPFQKNCVAYTLNMTASLPRKKPSVQLPTRQVTLLILQKNSDFVLLEKRSATGIWGGLWSLPEISGTPSEKDVQKICRERFAYTIKDIQFGEKFRHTFSHFHLEIAPAFLDIKERKSKIMEAEQQIWYNLQQPSALGLPAPIKKLLSRLTT
jgi:A/G-specific adenine glycosylase